MLEFLAYLALGKLLIFLAQAFPFQELIIIGKLWKRGFLAKLWACDLCLGVWIYFILALVCKVNFFPQLGCRSIIFEFVTGAFASFVVHVFSIGWSDKFGTILVE